MLTCVFSCVSVWSCWCMYVCAAVSTFLLVCLGVRECRCAFVDVVDLSGMGSIVTYVDI